MRTNIVIDERLMRQAMRASGSTSKKQAVEEGLKLLVQLDRQREVRKLRGKVRWQGDLAKLRSARA